MIGTRSFQEQIRKKIRLYCLHRRCIKTKFTKIQKYCAATYQISRIRIAGPNSSKCNLRFWQPHRHTSKAFYHDRWKREPKSTISNKLEQPKESVRGKCWWDGQWVRIFGFCSKTKLSFRSRTCNLSRLFDSELSYNLKLSICLGPRGHFARVQNI